LAAKFGISAMKLLDAGHAVGTWVPTLERRLRPPTAAEIE
jgi:hypothetical protein